MRYIKTLDEDIIKELEAIVKEDKRYKSRYRAQAIMLSSQGKSVNELADIFGCKIRTIYRWFDRFEAEKVEAVFELKGRGRKPILTVKDDALKVMEYIKKLNINEICIAFEKEFIDGKNKIISKRMLKRFFKKIGISYKRARRSIFKDSKWKTYWQKLSQINSVKGFVKKGECDLYFFDESGFSLDSNVPYTWSEIGKPTKIPADRYATKINVSAFLNTKNKDLFYEMRTGSINSEITIALFDKFADKINNTQTIVILDNASIHTSKLFKSNIEKWKKKGITFTVTSHYPHDN